MTKKIDEVSSFVFYRSFYDVVTLIPDEAMRCRAYTAICEYAFHGVEPAEDEDVLVKMVFTQAKPQIDANNKRRENASAGGVAKKKKMEAKKSADVVPNMCQNTANGVPNVNETVNANVNANETVNEPVKVHAHENVTAIRFTPPALEDVQAYIAEQGLNIDGERFVDYYTANGWMVGKNKMRDWKAALRHWNRADERNMAKHRGYDSNPRMKGGDHNGTSTGKAAPQFGLCL